MTITSMPTTNEGTTEFPAHFALMKRKRKTCVRQLFGKTFSLIKVNKQAVFRKSKTRMARALNFLF